MDDAFLLPRLDERIDCFGRAFRLLFHMFLGQRCHGLQEPQHECCRQDQVNEHAKQQRPARQPLAFGTAEKHKRQELVEYDDDEHQGKRGLQDFMHAPGAIAENSEADQHRNRCGDELGEDRHRKRCSRPADSQPRFDLLFKNINIVLELAREEFPDFLVYAVDIRDQHQQPEQKHKRYTDRDHLLLRVGRGTRDDAVRATAPCRPGRAELGSAFVAWGCVVTPPAVPTDLLLLRALRGSCWCTLRFKLSLSACCFLAINPVGTPSAFRSRSSRLAISPRSRSWSYPARCSTPWSVRILTSSAAECPSWRAFWAAMSAEIAISPAKSFTNPKIGGKDKTSVGPSFPRNRLFSTRNSWLVVTSTFTVPRKRAARLARATNRSSADSLSPATRFRKITIQVASASCRLSVLLRSLNLCWASRSSLSAAQELYITDPYDMHRPFASPRMTRYWQF